jgi:ribosomal protein L20A (L18A)
MGVFRVRGYFKMGKNPRQPFSIEVEAGNEAEAKEKIYCLLGSRHHCKRSLIKIEEVRLLNA